MASIPVSLLTTNLEQATKRLKFILDNIVITNDKNSNQYNPLKELYQACLQAEMKNTNMVISQTDNLPPTSAPVAMQTRSNRKRKLEIKESKSVEIKEILSTINDANLLLLNKVHNKLNKTDKYDAFVKLLCDYLYYQNEMCRILIGRAIALKSNYKRWYDEQAGRVPFDQANISFICYLGASRRLSKNNCYCKDHQCKENTNCLTLNTIFNNSESKNITTINEVLVATYGTSQDSLIDVIREDARLKKAMQRERV